jgi:predicted RNA-binding protein with PIN domain
MGAWLAVVAPRGMADDLVQQWGRELQKVVASPDQKERLAQVGANAEWMSAADFYQTVTNSGISWSTSCCIAAKQIAFGSHLMSDTHRLARCQLRCQFVLRIDAVTRPLPQDGPRLNNE